MSTNVLEWHAVARPRGETIINIVWLKGFNKGNLVLKQVSIYIHLQVISLLCVPYMIVLYYFDDYISKVEGPRLMNDVQ